MSPLRRALADGDRDVFELAAPHDAQVRGLADGVADQGAQQVVHVAHRRAVESHDRVSEDDSVFVSRALRLHRHYDESSLLARVFFRGRQVAGRPERRFQGIPRRTLPWATSVSATLPMVGTGIETVTPRVRADVFNPSTLPEASTKGPPENPGYMTTSVCKYRSIRPPGARPPRLTEGAHDAEGRLDRLARPSEGQHQVPDAYGVGLGRP